MKNWGWSILSLACLLLAFQQWSIGFACLLISLIMILKGRKEQEGSQDENSKNN